MIRILAIDDDVDFHGFLKAKLPLEDFALTLVTSEEKFFEKFDSEIFDILLLDLLIDDNPLKGFEILTKIRQTKNSEIPAVVISSLSSRKMVSSALEMGANDFINKPVDRGLLIAKINAVVLGNQTFAKKLELGKFPGNQLDVTLKAKLTLKAITEFGVIVEGNAFVAKGAKIKLSSGRIMEVFGAEVIEFYSTGFTREENGSFCTTFEINPDNKALISKAKFWINSKQS